MFRINKSVLLLALVAFAFFNKLTAQEEYKLNPMYFHVFDKDSLRGFDEEAARASAISLHYFGAEFNVKMYNQKRAYINDKYNLWPKFDKNAPNWTTSGKVMVSPACNNEDFEATPPGTITTSGAVTGWTVTRGSHTINPGGNSCNLSGCCPQQPVESAVFDAPTGYIDPVIGACYPIFSVFGTTAGDPNGAINNPQIVQPMMGNKFFRLNSSALGNLAYSIEKLSKTFSVTPNNALFQFAFISVFSTGHDCCGAGAFQIKLTNATAGTVITCPSYSASAPSSSCENYTVNGINFLVPNSCTVASLNSGIVFNKWQMASLDLTDYIGQNVTIDVIASDCDASGHYGYVYFDAQCGPMVVYGNAIAYGAGSGTINVPTCGALGATICASSGLGPYKWAGLGVAPPFDNYSTTNQCFTTSLSATYTLYMNPPGSCAPIERVISTTITPEPILLGSVLQAVCGNSTAVVTVTPAGSAVTSPTLVWSPTPFSLNGSNTAGTFTVPPTPTASPIVVTITAQDVNNCFVVTTTTVNPAPPIPTFSVTSAGPTASITCLYPSVNLVANTTYTYGAINYVWNGAAANYTGQNVSITTAGNYTVQGFDPLSLCYGTPIVYNVPQNITPPTSSITPNFQLITCTNSAVQTVTATALTPSSNVTHLFNWGIGGNVSTSQQTAIISPPPGTHTYVLKNDDNGCTTTKTFTVATAVGFPSFTLISPVQSFSVGCIPKNVCDLIIFDPNTTPTPGGSLSFTLLTAASSTNYGFNSTASFSITAPGQYTVVTRDDVTNCETKVPVSIIQNTVAPNRSVALLTQTLSCFTPSVLLVGSSETPNSAYQWSTTSGVIPGNTVLVNTTANQSTTLINTYQFIVTDNTNACKNNTFVPMYQNIFLPKALIVPQSGGTVAISCLTPSVTLVNQSSTGIPANSAFPTGGLLIGRLWEGPSPQIPKQNSSNYLAYQPGTYSLTVQDMNNGCVSSTVFPVGDARDYPEVVQSSNAGILDCGALSATLSTQVTQATNPVRYEWFSGSGLIKTATLTSFPGAATATVPGTGEYFLIVTNITNGCVTRVESHVDNGSIKANLLADKITGFAPLTVNFTNKSETSLDKVNIVSVWNYGNGTVVTTPSIMATSATFNQPGTYTVTLYANKSSCQDDTSIVISVEIPSKLEVPNVFTPNDDKVNDIFFLRTANLTEIKASIYDRWGNLVYEVTSESGNIAWDGKNQAGQKVAEGTYFYIITSKGKDGKDYDTKGTVSLYR